MKRSKTLNLGMIGTATAVVLMGSTAHADVLLSTGFDSPPATTNGNSLENVSWTQAGLTTSSTVTISAATNNSLIRSGHLTTFDVNIGSGGVWTATVSITTGANAVTLTDIVADMTNFEGRTDFFHRAPRDQKITAVVSLQGGGALTGGTASFDSAVYDSQQLFEDTGDPSIDHPLVFASPLSLAASTTYDVVFTVENGDADAGGQQSGFDNLTFNGTVVPEPGSLALMGLGGLLIARRRRG